MWRHFWIMLQKTTKEDHSTMGFWYNCDGSIQFIFMWPTSRPCWLVLVNRNTVLRLEIFIEGCSNDTCVCCSARDKTSVCPLPELKPRHQWSISNAPPWKRSSSQLSLSWMESPMAGSELIIAVVHGKKRRWKRSKTDCRETNQD